ncbi:agglutinin biogenesis protein MshI [Alteromonas sp. 1_MG-2023]|uniref:agglutinin biogenesis protein MshI n=1 Tax=Alteromonas sp. 1_MG-2023 TaxID=3062669 RepID=UPI0026E432A4|nr:agglutinin biogenesis protein MshI [Alteromonas sp. 1_MG-2023]MDO6566684.1 agglutinin biogenesis protein MshI [Alteromonas sp. 1_MG-2023]
MQFRMFSSQNKAPNLVVGVSICASEMHVVAVEKKENIWQLHSNSKHDLSSGGDIENIITTVLTDMGKQACSVAITLSQESYHMVQVEKPDVPEVDIVNALPWTLGDLVPYESSNIVLDYIDYPVKDRMGGQKIDVFAADKSELSKLVTKLAKLKTKQLSHIHVKEVLTTEMLPDDDYARLLIIQEPGSEPFVMIIRARTIWLARRLRGFVSKFNEQVDIAQVTDALGLEIQRSMDFYESQLKQPPLKEILFKIQVDSAPIIERLKPFQPVNMGTLVPDLPLADVVDPACHYALASALAVTAEAVKS